MSEQSNLDSAVAGELPPLVQMLLVEWQKNVDQINNLSDKLNTDAGAAAIQKRCADMLDPTVTEALVRAINSVFNDTTIEEKVGIIYTISQATSDVRGVTRKFIDEEVKKAPTLELPEAEVTALRDERKDSVKAANALRTAVETAVPGWAKEVPDENVKNPDGTPKIRLDYVFPEQKNLRGSGPRAKSPRLKGSFIWVVDDEPVDGDKIADVARSVGVPVAELKSGLIANFKERGIDFSFDDPPKSFAFELIHGDPEDEDGHAVYKIRATRKDSDPEDTDEDDEAFDEPEEGDELFQ